MDNKIFSFLIAMAMTVAGISLSSCGNDDNGSDSTPKATVATAQPEVCIKSDMFNYFDITCTIDGETVTLTKDNTYETSYTPYTSRTSYDNVCMYRVSPKQYTNFPAKMTVTVQSKVKDGVDLRTVEKMSYLLYVDIAPGNNNSNSFSPNNHHTGIFSLITNSKVKDLKEETIKKLENATVTKTATFETAGGVVVE